jgi:hypothetical protein
VKATPQASAAEATPTATDAVDPTTVTTATAEGWLFNVSDCANGDGSGNSDGDRLPKGEKLKVVEL